MVNLKKLTIAAASAAVLATAVVPSQAIARGWHHGGYHGHHGHGGSAWPFALVGGLAAGALIASAANDRDDRYYGRPVAYAPPAPAYYAPQRPCSVVNRLEDVEGYTVKMAATMCYDSSGRAYIVKGSEHPVDDAYDY
ncbi:hypothetical protein [Emcibacter sp. SYSU 3D8]|uniref:hypothetical protein n=1 Tax=Emcibacter sp. SYSU 3D8 TaxID=3133969 RepID=UPI0031FE5D59